MHPGMIYPPQVIYYDYVDVLLPTGEKHRGQICGIRFSWRVPGFWLYWYRLVGADDRPLPEMGYQTTETDGRYIFMPGNERSIHDGMTTRVYTVI